MGLPFYTHANDNQLTEQEKQQGWQLLFDGKSLSHWRTYQKKDISPKWRIENGAITLTQSGAGDIITRQQFDEFNLSRVSYSRINGSKGHWPTIDIKPIVLEGYGKDPNLIIPPLRPGPKR